VGRKANARISKKKSPGNDGEFFTGGAKTMRKRYYGLVKSGGGDGLRKSRESEKNNGN